MTGIFTAIILIVSITALFFPEEKPRGRDYLDGEEKNR